MPTYNITDPTSGKSVKLTGDSPPTEQELEQIFSTLTPKPEPTGGLGDKLGQRWKNIQNIVQPEQPQHMGQQLSVPLQVGGQIAGGALETGMAAAGAAYKAVVPEEGQKSFKEAGKRVLDTPIGRMGVGAAKQGMSYWNLFKKSYPTVAADIEAAINIGSLIPAGKGAQAAGKEALAVGKDVKSLAAGTPLSSELDAAINRGVEKTILTTKGNVNAKDIAAFKDKASIAVKDIVTNKEGLVFSDTEGGTISGKLPKTLSQWDEVVAQGQAKALKTYDAMNKAAGGKGATVDLVPLADKLEAFGESKVLMTENPEAAKYALEKAARYRQAGTYTAQEAQDAMIELNAKRQEFLRHPSPQKAIDLISGNNIRATLNAVVESAEGPGYAEAKKIYGAYATIQEDLTKKAIRDMAKMGGPQWLDVLAGSEFITGLATMSPTSLIRGTTVEGFRKWRTYYKDPNRYVKNMFQDAEKIIERQKGFKPQSFTGKKIKEYMPQDFGI